MGQREHSYKPIIQRHLERTLGRPFRDLPELSDQGRTPDFETADDRTPTIVVEAKELVPEEFLSVRAEVLSSPPFDSKRLTKRWYVEITEKPLSGRLRPMPRFPDDPPDEERERWEQEGFHLVTKAEREAKHRADNTLRPRRRTIQVRGLAERIEPHFVTLEADDINTSRGPELGGLTLDAFDSVCAALREIGRHTWGAICTAEKPFEGQNPGIDLCFGHGGAGTGPNGVAEIIQVWLDDGNKQVHNLKDSLRDSNADERHAVLWLSTHADQWTAEGLGQAYLPSLALTLPSEVDVVWIFLGRVVMRFDGSWSTTMVAELRAEGATDVVDA